MGNRLCLHHAERGHRSPDLVLRTSYSEVSIEHQMRDHFMLFFHRVLFSKPALLLSEMQTRHSDGRLLRWQVA